MLCTPSHRSQSKVSGTAVSAGCSCNPCGQMGRFVQAWTSVTLPISPDQIISAHCRVPSLEYPGCPSAWRPCISLPPASAAALPRWCASAASGTKTCLPRSMRPMRRRAVHEVGNGHDHRVDVLLLLVEHLAEVFVLRAPFQTACKSARRACRPHRHRATIFSLRAADDVACSLAAGAHRMRCSIFRSETCSPALSAKACCRIRRREPRHRAVCRKRSVVG